MVVSLDVSGGGGCRRRRAAGADATVMV